MTHAVVNLDKVDVCVDSFNVDDYLSKWVAKSLKKEIVIRREWLVPSLIVVSDDEHVRKAIENGEDVFEILFCDEINNEIRHVLDWLTELEQRDARLFSKLDRITWKQAVEHSTRWHEALARRAEKLERDGIPFDENCPVVLECDDGMRWVWLKTDKARDDEGRLMGHCVGQGGYDDCSDRRGVFSLRDSNGIPHVTMFLRDEFLMQSVTKGNQSVPDKYCGYVWSATSILGLALFMKIPLDFNNVNRLKSSYHVSCTDKFINYELTEPFDGFPVFAKRSQTFNGGFSHGNIFSCRVFDKTDFFEIEFFRKNDFSDVISLIIRVNKDFDIIDFLSSFDCDVLFDATIRQVKDLFLDRLYSSEEHWSVCEHVLSASEWIGDSFDDDSLKMSWYRNGVLHRETGPSVLYSNGSEEWISNGVYRQSDYSIKSNCGDFYWLEDYDSFHREDGPAVIFSDGTEQWYRNGEPHREFGPAKIFSNGRKEWWVNGEFVETLNDKSSSKINF